MRPLVPALVPLLLTAAVACSESREPVADPATVPDTTTTTIARPEGYDDPWCVSARSLAAASASMDAVDPTDPDAVRTAVTDMLDEAEAAAPLAPPEIADDVQAALVSFRELDAALAAVDYDLLRADLSGIADDQGPSDRVEAYNVEVCGLEPPTTSEPGGTAFDPSAGPLRDQLVANFVARGFTQDEAECIIDHVDVTDPEQMADEQVVLQLIETCAIDLERLTGTATTVPPAGG